jgi:phage terminase Nu1 subunit (DNA packaging protein)
MGTAPGAPSTAPTPNQQQQPPVQQKDIDDIKTKITQLQGLLAKSQQTQQLGSQPAAQQQQPKLGGY